MQQILGTLVVVDEHNKVGSVLALLAPKTIRDLETEIVVFHIGAHLGMRLGHAAEFPFPLAIHDHPVDGAMLGAGRPKFGLAGIEPYMIGRAGGIVSVQENSHRSILFEVL